MPPAISSAQLSGPKTIASRLSLSRAIFTLLSVIIRFGTRLSRPLFVFLLGAGSTDADIPLSTTAHQHSRRNHAQATGIERRAHLIDSNHPHFVLFVILIPVLVLLSGLFAGLTLGYMSLDETQLNVLSVGGTACVLLILSLLFPSLPFLLVPFPLRLLRPSFPASFNRPPTPLPASLSPYSCSFSRPVS
jgi:hypothetical protein